MISKRLKEIAKFSNGYNNLLDVGSDHGLLPIYALKQGFVKSAIASDINYKPLIKAKENFIKNNVNIETIIYDGIPETNSDCIVISGMGSELIIDILEKTLSNAKSLKRLILSPNCDYDMLRAYATKSFKIVDEDIIYDKNHYYEIIVLEKGIEQYSEKELMFGPILLKKRSETFLNKHKKELNDYLKIVDNITDKVKKEEIENKIKMLKDLI